MFKKKIIYTAHCILNQNAVVKGWERAQGAFNNILKVLLEQNISVIQLPCPEFIFSGKNRLPKTKKEYDVPVYRNICNKLARRIVNQMEEYVNNDYQIIGLLGIEGSPTCDSLDKKGIFMEGLFALMNSKNIYLNSFDIPRGYLEGEDGGTVRDLYLFCTNKLSTH